MRFEWLPVYTRQQQMVSLHKAMEELRHFADILPWKGCEDIKPSSGSDYEEDVRGPEMALAQLLLCRHVIKKSFGSSALSKNSQRCCRLLFLWPCGPYFGMWLSRPSFALYLVRCCFLLLFEVAFWAVSFAT